MLVIDVKNVGAKAERLIHVRESFGLIPKAFADLLSEHASNYYGYESGERTIGKHKSTELLSKINKLSNDIRKNRLVNELWWETGEGHMFTNSLSGNTITQGGTGNQNLAGIGSGTISVGEDYNPRTDFNVSNQVSRDKPNMWMVPIKAQAGFVKGFEGRMFRNQIQQVAWPLVNGECFCFEVEGLSMFPAYMPHSWLVCTILEDMDWLRKGKSYVFQTYEGLYIKQFDRIDNNLIYLNSLNSDYPIDPIPVSELRLVYTIEGRYMKE